MLRIGSLRVLSTVVVLAGCYSYRAVPLAGVAPKNRVRVSTRDGRREELTEVTVASDSVRGVRTAQRWLWSRRGSVTIPVADLTQVEVQRLDVARSTVAGAASMAVVVLVLPALYPVLGCQRGSPHLPVMERSSEVLMLRIRLHAVVWAVVALAGCYSYRVVSLASVAPRSHVRVTIRDGRQLEVADATVASDSVRGKSTARGWILSRRAEVAVAVADMGTAEVRRLEVVRSTGAGVTGTGLATAAAAGRVVWPFHGIPPTSL